MVKGNYIGTDETGTVAMSNGDGVFIGDGPQTNTIGPGNVISGNSFNGVKIWGSASANNVVKGNYIGTDAAGSAALGNGQSGGGSGVSIEGGAYDNTVGGTGTGDGNAIAASPDAGVTIIDSGSDGNVVQGNRIGTNAAGTAALSNRNGVYVGSGACDNTIGGTATGEGNLIAFNSNTGVLVNGAATNQDTISRNSIHSNTVKGIDNINGGNLELAPPLIDSVGHSVSGHTSPKCYPCTVEVFSDSQDEGRVYHGSTTTNNDATGTWIYPGTVTGPNITATVTDASGNTSEFSAPVAYSPPVGGIQALPDVPGAHLEASASDRSRIPVPAEVAAALAASVVALGASGWYARRRRLR